MALSAIANSEIATGKGGPLPEIRQFPYRPADQSLQMSERSPSRSSLAFILRRSTEDFALMDKSDVSVLSGLTHRIFRDQRRSKNLAVHSTMRMQERVNRIGRRSASVLRLSLRLLPANDGFHRERRCYFSGNGRCRNVCRS